MNPPCWRPLIVALFALLVPSAAYPAPNFNYHELVAHTLACLTVRFGNINVVSGAVTITGSDTGCPTIPFTVNWGDGKHSEGFFPLKHTYRDRKRDYIVSLTAHYGGKNTGSASAVVRFQSLTLPLAASNTARTVSIPQTVPEIISTEPNHPVPSLEPFPESSFRIYSREVIQHVMNEIAAIQLDLVNNNVFETDGPFRQIILAQPETAPYYAYSLWYTRPAVMVAQPSVLRGTPDWSSIAHEMGHNITLNTPKVFRLGKVAGAANAIVSESLAQIFQHVTCYELVNHASERGIPEVIAEEIAHSALDSFASLKRRSLGSPFSSWNHHASPSDETLPTFMTIAYQFLAACDLGSKSYSASTKRLMFFLQHWSPAWKQRFSPQKNSNEAETFRSTMMVAAVSFGVDQDLRDRFRTLGFPVDDRVFNELTAEVGSHVTN